MYKSAKQKQPHLHKKHDQNACKIQHTICKERHKTQNKLPLNLPESIMMWMIWQRLQESTAITPNIFQDQDRSIDRERERNPYKTQPLQY